MILCVGALTMDTIFRLHVLPAGPGKFIPLDAVEVAEGMAAAQAVTIARLGGKAMLWASRGDDATGERLVVQIAGEGVDCSLVRVRPGARSAFSTVFMDQAGERIIVPRYDPELVSPPATIPDVDFSTLGVVMADVRWPAAAEMALVAAGKAGVPGILDADVAARETLDRLVPLASHVVASEPAARLLTGADDAIGAVGQLGRDLAGFVAVTVGADGCYWFDRGAGAVRHTPSPKVTAVDTLAAGDVFHGAFAFGLTEGMEMADIMRFASAAAAIKCTRFGGRLGAPTLQEMKAFGF